FETLRWRRPFLNAGKRYVESNPGGRTCPPRSQHADHSAGSTPTRSPSGVENAQHVTGESAWPSPVTARKRTCTYALALSCAQCLADARAAAHASSRAAPHEPPQVRTVRPHPTDRSLLARQA